MNMQCPGKWLARGDGLEAAFKRTQFGNCAARWGSYAPSFVACVGQYTGRIVLCDAKLNYHSDAHMGTHCAKMGYVALSAARAAC